MRCLRLYVVLLFPMLVVLLSLSGCRGEGKEGNVERPHFAMASVELLIGETVENLVEGATQVEPVSVPEIVAVAFDGPSVRITGRQFGEGTLTVRADGQAVRCHVRVLGATVAEEPETSAQIQAQLSDPSLRIAFGNRLMRYENPGSLFTLSADGNRLSATSLTTGESLMFSCDDIALRGTDGSVGTIPAELPVEEVKFEVNGTPVALAQARVMQHNATGMWIRMLSLSNEAIWIVVPSDF